MAKANLRLKKPSSYAPLASRVAVLDVLWGGISPLAAFLLRDGTIYSPAGVTRYCVISFFVSLLVFQWFQTSSPISRFYSLRDAFELFKACVLIAALTAVASFLLTRLEEAPRSIPILHFLLLAAGLLGGRVLLRLRQSHRDAPLSQAAKDVDHVLIIQASRLAWFFTKMVEELAPDRYRIVAILDDEPKLKHRSLNGYPIVGAPSDLEKIVADYAMHGVRIDKVVLAAQPQDLAPDSWDDVSRLCRKLDIVLQILPERLISEDAADRPDSVVVAHPNAAAIAPQYDLGKSLDRPFWALKRAGDLALALFSAVVLSPIAVVVCVLVLSTSASRSCSGSSASDATARRFTFINSGRCKHCSTAKPRNGAWRRSRPPSGGSCKRRASMNCRSCGISFPAICRRSARGRYCRRISRTISKCGSWCGRV